MRNHNYLLFAWIIAFVAMVTSLIMQYFFQWPVCNLCWYQRIALYPLVLLLGMAIYREDSSAIVYAYPFPAIGFIVGLYQYLEQMIPGFSPISVCTEISCAVTHIKWFGFITIPFLSIIACAAIFFLLRAAHK